MNILALSGGKDSTCLALILKEQGKAVQYVYTPTGDELPEMTAHWQRLEALLGPIHSLTGITMSEMVREQAMLPNWRARFCTRLLKIAPFEKYLASHAPATVYIGLRADEESRDGAIYDIPGVTVEYPLRDLGMSKTDVLSYLRNRGIDIPPRTDCARCFFQTISEWWRLWKFYPEIYADAVEDERYISEVRGKVCTYRNDKKDNWPTSLADLALAFESGRMPKNKHGVPASQSTFNLSSDRDTMCSFCSR